jgi:hypothetical protein
LIGQSKDLNSAQRCPPNASHYLAPECYDDVAVPETDVFSFGMILYELVIGRSALPKSLNLLEVGCRLVVKEWKRNIPDSVHPETTQLIHDCVATDYFVRPSFRDIPDQLELSDSNSWQTSIQ